MAKQNYPPERYEIIVSDDSSEDSTREIVSGMMKILPNLKLIDTRFSKSTYAYKKRAIYEAILASRGEIIVTLDADCRVGENWLKTILSNFNESIDIVAGSVRVEYKKFSGCLEALEFSGIQAIASGLMNAGFPVTCNGGNLAYRRVSFDKVGGFGDIGNIVSGDDDLLMQKITKNHPGSAVWVNDPEACVYTDSGDSLVSFLSRRARWASKILMYPSKKAIFMLVLFFLFFLSLVIGLVMTFAGLMPLKVIITGLCMKFAADLIMTGVGLFSEKRIKMIWLVPFAEIFHIPYIIAVSLKGCFGSLEWNGRKSGSTLAAVKRV